MAGLEPAIHLCVAAPRGLRPLTSFANPAFDWPGYRLWHETNFSKPSYYRAMPRLHIISALLLLLPTAVMALPSEPGLEPFQAKALSPQARTIADGPPRLIVHFDTLEKLKPYVWAHKPRHKRPQ
jgi:hypothetical protein